MVSKARFRWFRRVQRTESGYIEEKGLQCGSARQEENRKTVDKIYVVKEDLQRVGVAEEDGLRWRLMIHCSNPEREQRARRKYFVVLAVDKHTICFLSFNQM